MIITVGGTPGSGKSTIAKKLAEILGWERFYIGGILRELAIKRGITIEELMKIAIDDPSIDKFADDKIVELARKKNNVIIEGRTAYYFVPNSIKLFFDVGLKEGAHRIFLQNRTKEEHFGREEDVLKSIKNRIKSDSKRYLNYYNIDCYDRSLFDIVIQTSHKSIAEVLKETIERLEGKGISFK